MPTAFQGTASKPTTIANVADNKGLFSFPPPKPKPVSTSDATATQKQDNQASVEAGLVALDPEGTFQHNTGSRLKRKPVAHSPEPAAARPAPKQADMATPLANDLAAVTQLLQQLQQANSQLQQELLKRDEQVASRDRQIIELTSFLEPMKRQVDALQAQVDELTQPKEQPAPEQVKAEANSQPKPQAVETPTVDVVSAPSASEAAGPPAAEPVPSSAVVPAEPAVAPSPTVPAGGLASSPEISAASMPQPTPATASSETGLSDLALTEELQRSLAEFSKLYNRVETRHRQPGGTLHPIEETLAKYQYQPKELIQVLYRNYRRTNSPEDSQQKVVDDLKQMIAAVVNLMPAEQVKEVQKEVAEKFGGLTKEKGGLLKKVLRK